jgi:hypothetical protein
VTVNVTTGGRIVARGDADHVIGFVGSDPAQPWASIRANGGTLDLEYTGLVGGGDRLNYVDFLAAMIDLSADQTMPPTEILHADHLLIQDSATNGIYMHNSGGFSATSNAVKIIGAKGYPIHTWSNLAGTIPPGEYTGNTTDEILLSATGQAESMTRDVTFHDRGVPYHVGHSASGASLRVQSGVVGTAATLTIEPGVTLRFKKGGDLEVEHFDTAQPAEGALIAIGTPDKPIVFTSAEPAPAAGDWLGLFFGSIPDPNTRLDYVLVEYAGGASTSGVGGSCLYPGIPINDGAIRIGGEPANTFVTNTTVKDSAAHGIDRSFRSDIKPDFLPTNTFINVALCRETFPRDVSGACPATVPCP